MNLYELATQSEPISIEKGLKDTMNSQRDWIRSNVTSREQFALMNTDEFILYRWDENLFRFFCLFVWEATDHENPPRQSI